MNKVLIQTIETILNQNHNMAACANLVDSTDNGTFRQAEIQMNGTWVGDVDLEAMQALPFIEVVDILAKKAQMFYFNYSKAIA